MGHRNANVITKYVVLSYKILQLITICEKITGSILIPVVVMS